VKVSRDPGERRKKEDEGKSECREGYKVRSGEALRQTWRKAKSGENKKKRVGNGGRNECRDKPP